MKRVAGECWVEEDLTLCPAPKGLVGVEQPVVVVLLAAQVSGDGGEAKNGRTNGEMRRKCMACTDYVTKLDRITFCCKTTEVNPYDFNV